MKIHVSGVVTRTIEVDVDLLLEGGDVEEYWSISENRRERWLEDMAMESAWDDHGDVVHESVVLDFKVELEEGDEDYVPPVLIHPNQGTLV